jgi:methyl-accepting chemotaxis protein
LRPEYKKSGWVCQSISTDIQEINTIALTTDTLAADAAVKASNVGSAGRGFSVLAREMGDLAKRSLAAAARMQEIIKSATVSTSGADAGTELAQKEFSEAIRDINVMARQTNYLAMNAAVQAAYIEEAGRGFESFTEAIQWLSVSTRDAALRIEGLIRSSVELARTGKICPRDIDGGLLEVVEGVTELADIVERIATASGEQTEGVAAVNTSLSRIERVTEQFAANAGESFSAARTLEGQAVDLKTMVGRFQLNS